MHLNRPHHPRLLGRAISLIVIAVTPLQVTEVDVIADPGEICMHHLNLVLAAQAVLTHDNPAG